MTVNPCSTRQFPDDPVTIEIIEGEPDEDDPSLSSSNDDVKPERVAYITTTVPWEVSIPEEKALVRHHSPSLNTTGYENVRKTYNLMNTKTLLKVGYIDLGLRLTCMGTNIWNRLKKMNKFKQQSSESDRSPIISEPQTEDENVLSQREEETSIIIGTDDESSADTRTTVATKFPTIKKEVFIEKPTKKVTIFDSKKDMKDTLSKILMRLMKYEADTFAFQTPHNVVEGFNVNVCDTKSCPNPPRDRYDAGLHSCSEIFGPGSARAKFCRKSKKKEFSVKLPCTNKTCLARQPMARPTCGPCIPETRPPGVCCPIPGRICQDCGGFSASGRTCHSLKVWKKKNPPSVKRAKERERKQKTIYDCLKVCPSSTITSKKVPYPGTCYPHGVPDDGGGACILQDGPKVQPKILRGPIRVPFGAGREMPLRRPKVNIPVPEESAYVYSAGERNPPARDRHQDCGINVAGKKVPPNMGWLWSHRPLPGVKKLPGDWRPGYINEDIKALAEERRRKMLENNKYPASNTVKNKKNKTTENIYMVLAQPYNSKNILIDGVESHVEFDLKIFEKVVLSASDEAERDIQREQECIQIIQNNIGAVCRKICYDVIGELEI